MAVFGKILQVLASIVPFILDWWAKRKAAKNQADAEDRVADIRADPGPEWVRKFNSRANSGDNPADPPGTDQPDGDK